MKNIKIDIDNLIDLYTNKGYSSHKLGSIFGFGHKKITEILKSNNVEIKKRGGQIKNGNSKEIEKSKTKLYDFENDLFVAKCKKTNLIIKDPNNLSGKLTKHILLTYGDVKIPSNNYQRKKYEQENGKKWFEEYFDIIKFEKCETRKCQICDWETSDVENKTGSFKKHIEGGHNIDILEYLEKFPEEKKYHISDIEKQKRKIEFFNIKNFVKCEICGEKFKTISNSHLKNKHNMDVIEYKLLYPNSKIVCDLTSGILAENIKKININLEPSWTSKGELEIKEFIETLGFSVEKGKNRKLLEGKEIDLIIPELRIGIEYNGLYYHTENMGKNSSYHLNKLLFCNQIGYKLIQIFEDEWVTKKEIVKNKLRHILKKNDGVKIGARKTIVKKIEKENKSFFLNENHIQGNDKSTIYYGAFFEDVLVGVMTFNSRRNMTKNNLSEYELSRFCTKNGFIVSGLASKMLSCFIKEFSPRSIISFADRRWTTNGNSNMYIDLGFKLKSILKPSYSYYNSKYNKYRRFHKFSFGKNNLKKRFPNLDLNKSENELTQELGFNKIWDCGLFKYELSI